MARADRTLMFLNLPLLLTVAFLPFPTKLVAQYLQQSGERDAVYAYDLTFVLMAIVLLASVLVTFAIAAFYLPSAALFAER